MSRAIVVLLLLFCVGCTPELRKEDCYQYETSTAVTACLMDYAAQQTTQKNEKIDAACEINGEDWSRVNLTLQNIHRCAGDEANRYTCPEICLYMDFLESSLQKAMGKSGELNEILTQELERSETLREKAMRDLQETEALVRVHQGEETP